MPRPSAAARFDLSRRLAWAVAAVTIALAGCGGGGSDSPPPAPQISAGPNCPLQYTLTDSPLLTGADPLLADQWHLQNTGQNGGTPGEDTRARLAWATTKGAGIRVAVVDDGVEIVHPDLAPNVVAGASFSYRSGNRGSVYPVPCTADDDHGTSVAGIVLARDDNALGGAGVAPRASLVAYDALASSLDADVADALGRASDQNAIYQNSWGSPDDGAVHRAEASFVSAIEAGIAGGRGGRGSIFVFPAGNGGCLARDRATGLCQVDNSNLDGYVNQRGVITVCAVDDSGRQAWYGEPGANVLVCAPSSGDKAVGITTTTIRSEYRNNFSGTSASTPMVSGVVALMLATNPQLTWRDVRLILAATARQNDPGNAGWTSHYGYRFNHRFGFGVADAQAAVAAAQTWTSVGGSAQQKVCGPYVRTPVLPLRDPGAGGALSPATDSVTVTGCDISQIEFVEIRLTTTHPYIGDLRLRLTSPNGLASELADQRLCAGSGGCGNYADWPFGSVRHLGEPANGVWTFEATDMAVADEGSFDRWSIRFYGR